MKKFMAIVFASVLAVSVSACSAGSGQEASSAEGTAEAETSNDLAVVDAAAGNTYTGTVKEADADRLVLITEEAEVNIPLSETTEFLMGGGMDTPPDGQDGAPLGDQNGTPPDGQDGTPPDGQGGAPSRDKGNPPQEGDAEGTSDGEKEPAGDNAPAQGGMRGEDIPEGAEVTVVVGEDGTAETVTISGSPMGGAPDGMGGAPGGMGGASQAPETYDAATEYTTDTEVSGEEFSSSGKDENAVLVATDGITATLDNVTITRVSEDSTGGDASSFYGIGAAALTTDGILSISNSEITSDASGGAGVFAYGDGTAYVSDTAITTEQDTSGGIHVAGGGSLYAWNLTVDTQGESAAAIRSDRGSGTMVVDGGTYTSNGVGSPAVYSTADITVHDAELTAAGSEAICIEGLNTIRLFDCDLSGNMSDLEQNDCTWNVILYQSMSGDSEVGNSTFEMVGGTLTADNGGMFYTTNTESTFILSDVKIVPSEDNAFLLKCTGNSNERGWGTPGANGADCHFTAIAQSMEGDVIWDSISNLDFYLTRGSILTGAFVQDESNAGDGGDGYSALYIDGSSTWIVTGDSVLTSLSGNGGIVDEAGRTVSVAGTDGTVYVSGDSEYTVTVENYTENADISGASGTDTWEDFEVPRI